MESVSPVLVVAAGTAVVGVAAAVSICFSRSKPKATPAVAKPPTKASTTKPKKKSKSSKNKTDGSNPEKSKPVKKQTTQAEDEEEDEDSDSPPAREASPERAPSKQQQKAQVQAPAPAPAAAPVPAPAPAPAPVVVAPVVADIPVVIEVADESETSELSKKKKPKETPEQKAARLERQKITKAAKKLETESQAESKPTFSQSDIYYDVLGDQQFPAPAADGWAVVEDKRKPKKPAASAGGAPKSGDSSPVSRSTSGPGGGAAAVAAAVAPPVVEIVKTTMTVEPKKMGIIIGPKGVTLKAIQEATGVEISTPKDREVTPAVVGLSGSAAGVTLATKAINDLCTKGYAPLLEGDDFSEGHVAVHPMYIPDLIGKQGIVRRQLQDHTGVHITIPAGVTREQTVMVKVGLAGPRGKVAEAKKLIKELMKYYHTPVTHPGLVHVEMEVPAAMFPFIIGPKGSEIKHIQANYKVSVYIPNENSVTKELLVVGTPVGVEGAQRHIQKIVDNGGRVRPPAPEPVPAPVVEEDDDHEPWMDEYTHPSKRVQVAAVLPPQVPTPLATLSTPIIAPPRTLSPPAPVSNGLNGHLEIGGGGAIVREEGEVSEDDEPLSSLVAVTQATATGAWGSAGGVASILAAPQEKAW